MVYTVFTELLHSRQGRRLPRRGAAQRKQTAAKSVERGDTMAKRDDLRTENKYRFFVFDDERFVDLNLYQFGWERCIPGHQFGPAARTHFLFHYIISGQGSLDTNGNTYTLKAGQGFLLCPGQVSTYIASTEDPWYYTWVEFDGLRARESMTLAGLGERQPIYTPASGGSRIQTFLMDIVDNHDKAPMRLVGLAMILLDEIVQTSKTRISQGDRSLRDFYMREVINYIDGNYRRDVSIEEIAENCGLNRSYFSRLFKECMGESPQRFLIHYRTAKAAELLKGTRLSIAEVSHAVGYENPLHFSRAFKKVYGISPNEYRRKHGYNQNP